jgi:hypothetical protein
MVKLRKKKKPNIQGSLNIEKSSVAEKKGAKL